MPKYEDVHNPTNVIDAIQYVRHCESKVLEWLEKHGTEGRYRSGTVPNSVEFECISFKNKNCDINSHVFPDDYFVFKNGRVIYARKEFFEKHFKQIEE